MEPSLFLEWVKKYFPGVVVKITEKVNENKNVPFVYLYKRFLKPNFNLSGKWETLSGAYTRVAADIVAMDSSLPLKSRDSMAKASGDITKIGMEMKLSEKQLTDLDTLVASNASEKVILQKLFQDTPRVITGVHERMEAMFLEGLSTGVTVVEDSENVGTGVRLDYGYLTENKFGVAALWSDPNALAIDDIKRVLAKADADGNAVTRVMLDAATIANLCKNNQVKEQFAFANNFLGTNIPNLSLTKLNGYTQAEFGFVFEKVERTIKVEKDGVRTNIKPWAAGAMVFLCSDNIGNVEWSKLAEMNHPVAGVEYQTADESILVSKYRMNRPSLSEYTSSQSRMCPVINDVEQIYLLDTSIVEA